MGVLLIFIVIAFVAWGNGDSSLVKFFGVIFACFCLVMFSVYVGFGAFVVILGLIISICAICFWLTNYLKNKKYVKKVKAQEEVSKNNQMIIECCTKQKEHENVGSRPKIVERCVYVCGKCGYVAKRIRTDNICKFCKNEMSLFTNTLDSDYSEEFVRSKFQKYDMYDEGLFRMREIMSFTNNNFKELNTPTKQQSKTESGNLLENIRECAISHDEVQKREKLDEKSRIIEIANNDYNKIKEILLNKSKTEGYYTEGDYKLVISYISPNHAVSDYKFDDGTNTRRSFFGEYKTYSSNITTYYPSNQEIWDIYISEINKLSRKDNISVDPILRSDLYNIETSFPTRTSDKKLRYFCGITLWLKCTAKFR